MADTFGGGTFGGGSSTSSTKFRFPSFRKVNDTDPFDVSQQPLFQQAQQTAGQQLSGGVPGFDDQANEARDAFKAAQSASAKAKREQLMGFGMRDSGQYISEGIVGTADQEVAARQQLERKLAVDRQNQMNVQQQAGQAAAGNLLGMQSQQAQFGAGVQSQERMQQEGFAFTGQQADLDRDLQANIESGRMTLEQAKLAQTERMQQAGFQQESTQSALDRAQQAMMQSADVEAQTALTELKGKIDQGMLLTSQDYGAAQAGLDRELQKYVSAGDWANAEKITTLKGEIDAQAQQSQRDWATVERIATQSWSSTERIDQQAFDRATQVLDQKQQTALQENDIRATQDIEKQRIELQLTMQTQDMTHDEKMANLGAQLDEAKANGDVDRQKTLMEYQTLQNLEEMKTQDGYDVAMTNLKGDIETALQNNDHTNAMSMMGAQQRFVAAEAVKDRDVDYARIELETKALEQQRDIVERELEHDSFWKDRELEHDSFWKSVDQKIEEAALKQERDIVERELEHAGFWKDRELEHDSFWKSTDQGFKKAALKQERDIVERELEHAGFWKDREFEHDSFWKSVDQGLQRDVMDMDKMQQQYEYLQTEVDAGRASPDAAFSFVQDMLKNQGIEIKESDPNAIYAELDRDFKLQQYQFALSNRDLANWASVPSGESSELNAEGTRKGGVSGFVDRLGFSLSRKNSELNDGGTRGEFLGLKDEGATKFNDFLNKNYYTEDGKINGSTGKSIEESTLEKNAVEILTGLRDVGEITSKEDPLYAHLLKTAPHTMGEKKTTTDEVRERKYYTNCEHSYDSGTPFEADGSLWVVIKLDEKPIFPGYNNTEYTLQEVGNPGNTRTTTAA